ncbi:hypothetical protein EHQ12_06975 [Leptospira gomenensis]|uniref:DUF6989 domain-containing protein n=1 Tax=Leptospira gomenensis TaxID=2484974 RepID=A0A5F1YG22_9LEPT|nr:hypothetical protein [Leptospira gomenensis]TGK37459.1 hypothetical protein EHQ17_02600 [Leptospira gomenensis]TGK40818.1 hypothetical protein EHQ12_06975 [Leptospira gomenensis]TGK43044.1 hypothetical protein EHQ07_12895 [Leptospira gomenensis]TGK54308.1 hypothetical protein EHQ13_19385 [Leptospira gomenensis]
MKLSEKHVLVFHILFFALSILVLFLPGSVSSGWRMFSLVFVYNGGILLFARIWTHERWTDLWFFLFPLSCCLVFPDWFLSQVLGVVEFPADGFPKIGTVSGYMAGLWVIPLFVSTFVSVRFRKRFSDAPALQSYLLGGLIAFVFFLVSEEVSYLIPVWFAKNVWMFDHVAVYVLAPEFILAVFACYAYEVCAYSSLSEKILWAFLTMFVYLGALGFFFLLLEGNKKIGSSSVSPI